MPLTRIGNEVIKSMHDNITYMCKIVKNAGQAALNSTFFRLIESTLQNAL